ncbi:hypothetical protein BJ508DRAFT_410811 [Ascobolus immersus RN42]|uniref:Uncharacterized protein n=1 Tax=Ascobolus immersus RN42 TaxID=1160509 RepID=A0A3N4ISY2_ASCIM|nr:hypothetical protein BJ508DRAFT_410811 [Ascobolus immersus RN42]
MRSSISALVTRQFLRRNPLTTCSFSRRIHLPIACLQSARLTANLSNYAKTFSTSTSRYIFDTEIPAKGIWIPPAACPGCGAPAQLEDPEKPGYYSLESPKLPKLKLKSTKPIDEEEAIYRQALERVAGEQDVLEELGVIAPKEVVEEDEHEALRAMVQPVDPAEPAEKLEALEEDLDNAELETDRIVKDPEFIEEELAAREMEYLPEEKDVIPQKKTPPYCHRCLSMLHHHTAQPLPEEYQADLESIAQLMTDAKHKNNHIYHLIDAADFPMSVIPRLRTGIGRHLPKYMANRLEVTAVITRSDLLLPKREMVTELYGDIQHALRPLMHEKDDTTDPKTRMRVISVRNGWDVGRIKEQIASASNSGGIWIVGKANVGKSRFVGEILPEGSFTSIERLPEIGEDLNESHIGPLSVPTVSDIPGTTAGPVRVAIGSKASGKNKLKMEIIDLPGLERTDFTQFVRPDKRLKLALKKRPHGLQQTLKPGQSMLIAGIILITPKTPDLTFLVHSFLDAPVHICATERALELMNVADPEAMGRGRFLWQNPAPVVEVKVGAADGHVQVPNPIPSEIEQSLPTDLPDDPVSGKVYETVPVNAAGPETVKWNPKSAPTYTHPPEHIQSAGLFALNTDSTMWRNPKFWVDSKTAKKMIAAAPYRIYSTDILLSTMGWVEIAAQVRRKRLTQNGDWDIERPEVEVWTPMGEGVGQRASLNIDGRLRKGEREAGKFGERRTKKGGRGRKSMKGVKNSIKGQKALQ